MFDTKLCVVLLNNLTKQIENKSDNKINVPI